jgi:hypothetical protein
MPCLFRNSEAEELRELLELSNSQREEYRKAAEGASRRAEHVQKQLEARLGELHDLSSHYQVSAAALLLSWALEMQGSVMWQLARHDYLETAE